MARSSLPFHRGKRLLLVASAFLKLANASGEIVRFVNPHELWSFGQYYNADKSQQIVRSDVQASDPEYDPGCDLQELTENGETNYICYLYQVPLNRQNINSIDYTFSSLHSVAESMDSLGLSGDAKLNIAGKGADAAITAAGGFLNEKINYDKKTTIAAEFAFTSHVLSLDHLSIIKPSQSMFQSAQEMGASHYVQEIVFGGRLQVKVTFDKSDSSEKKIGRFMGAISMMAAGDDEEAEEEEPDPRRKKRHLDISEPVVQFHDRLKFKKGMPDDFLTLKERYGNDTRLLEHYRMIEKRKRLAPIVMQNIHNIDCLHTCYCPCENDDESCMQDCDQSCLSQCNTCDSLCDLNCDANDQTCLEECEENSHCREKRQAEEEGSGEEGSADDDLLTGDSAVDEMLASEQEVFSQNDMSIDTVGDSQASTVAAAGEDFVCPGDLSRRRRKRRRKRSALSLEAAGCVNINDFELSSVTGLQIKIVGNPAPIESPLTLIDAIAYIGKYKDYLVNELNGEGVPSKVVLSEVKNLIPGLVESLYYLPSEFQLNAAVNFMDDYDQTAAYANEYENFFNTFARSNYDISLPFLSAKAKFENVLQGSKAALLTQLRSIDLSDARVNLTSSFRAYYNTQTGAPCQSGEKRYIRAIKHMHKLVAQCDDNSATGYCSGHGKCHIDETQDCVGFALRCECDNGWSSKNMTEPGQCNHNVCALNGSGEGSLCGAGDCIPDTRFERGYRCSCAPGSYGDNCEYNFCEVQQYRDVCDNNAKACMPRTDLANGPYYTCLCDHKHNSMSDNDMIQGVDFHDDGVSSVQVRENTDGWTVVGEIPVDARERTRSFYIMISNPTSTVSLKFSNIQVTISGADQQTKIVQNGDRVWFSNMNKPLANKVTEDTVFWFSWDIGSDRFVFGTGLSIGRNVIANVQKRSDYVFLVPLLNFETVLAKVHPRITREASVGSDNDFAIEDATDQTATVVIPVIKSYQDIDGYNCEFEKCNDNNDNRRRHCNFRGSCKRENELTRANRAKMSTFMTGSVDSINEIIDGWLNQKGFACVCDEGWYGPSCQFHICSATRNICLQHGLQHPFSECLPSDECNDGFWNPNDNRYYEVDNAGCINNRQVAFKCVNCASGWHGPAVGGQCQVSPCFEDTSHLTVAQLYEPGRLVNKCNRHSQYATCQPNNKEATGFYTCICPPGFSGDHCEINECDNFHGENYCQNGGVCSQSAEGPVCSCPSFAYGKRCQNTICDPYASTRGYALDSPCQNGAKCEVQAEHPFYRCVPTNSCRHDPQSEHDHCQIDACNDPAKPSCENDSLCVLDEEKAEGYRCICVRPWQDSETQCRNPEDICTTELNKCKGDTCVQDFSNAKGYRCECDTHTRGTFCEYQLTCPGDKLARIDTDKYSREYTLTCVDIEPGCNTTTHYSHKSIEDTPSYAGQFEYTLQHYNLLNRVTDDNRNQWCLPCHPDCNGCSAPYGLGYCSACLPEEEITTTGEVVSHDRLLFKDMGQADCVRREFCEDTDTESYFIDEDRGTCERCHRNCGGFGCVKPNNENGCKNNIACHTKVVIEGMRQATAKASLVIVLIDPDNREFNLNFEVTESRSYYVGCLEERVEVRAARLKITSMLAGSSTFEWWVRSIHVDYSRDGNWRAIPLVGVDDELFPRPFQRILITDNNFDRTTDQDIEDETVTVTLGEDYKTIIPRENQNYFLDPELGTGYFIAQIYSTESIMLTMGNIVVRLAGADGISSIGQWCDAELEDCADSQFTSISNAKNVVSSPVQPLSRTKANPEPRLFWFSWRATDSVNSFSVGMGGRPGTYGILQAEFISAQNNFALPYKLKQVSDVLMKIAPNVSPYQVTYPNQVNKTATAYVLDNGVSFSTYKLLKEYLGSTHICSGDVGDECELSVPALTKYERFEERLGCDDRPLPFNYDFFVYRGSVYHVPKDEAQRAYVGADGITRDDAQAYCQSIGVGFNLWCPKPDEFEIMKIGWANNFLVNQNYYTGYEVGDIGSFDIRYDYVHEDVQLQSNWWTCGTSASASLSKYYREILPEVGDIDQCINVMSDLSYDHVDCQGETRKDRFFVCAWDCGAREGSSRVDDFCLMTDEYGACLLLDCPTRYPEGWGSQSGTEQNFIATVDRTTCVPDDIEHCLGYEKTDDGHRCIQCEDDYIIEQDVCVPYVEYCLEYDLDLPTIVEVNGEYTAHGCAKCIYGRGVSGDRRHCVPEVVGCRYHSSNGYGCEECFSRDALTIWGTCKFVLDGTRSEQEIGSRIGDVYPVLPEGQKNYVRQATGRLETTIDGGNIWGTVCDDGFDEREATAACRNMGFRWGTALEREKVESGDDDMLIVYDNLQCSEPGMEKLYDCYHQGPFTHDCTHEEDVGVACYHQLYKNKEHDWQQRILGQNTADTDDDEYMIHETFRIIGDASYGRVETKTDLHQEWQSMCTTEEASDDLADLMCRNAGFTGGFQSFSEKVRPAPLGEFRMCEAKGEGYVPLGVECYPVTTCHNEQCSRIKTPLSTIDCGSEHYWNGEQCVCNVPTISDGVRVESRGETAIYQAVGIRSYSARNCVTPLERSSPMSVEDAQRLINLSVANANGLKHVYIDATYDHDTGKVTSSEGREIGQNIVRWCEGYPSTASSNTVALISSHADPTNPSSEETLCLFNADPSSLSANLICVWKSSDCATVQSGNANDQMAVDDLNDGNQKIGYVEVSDNYGEDYHRVLTSFSPRHYSVDPLLPGDSYAHDAIGSVAELHVHVYSMSNTANKMQIEVEVTFTNSQVYNFGNSHTGEDGQNGMIGQSMRNDTHDPNEFYGDVVLNENQIWRLSGVTGRPSSVKLSARNAGSPVDIVVDLSLHYQSLIYRIACPSSSQGTAQGMKVSLIGNSAPNTDAGNPYCHIDARGANLDDNQVDMNLVLDARFDLDRDDYINAIQRSRTDFSQATCNGLGYKFGWEKSTWIKYGLDGMHGLPRSKNLATFLPNPIREAFYIDKFLFIIMTKHDSSNDDWMSVCPDHTTMWDLGSYAYNFKINDNANNIPSSIRSDFKQHHLNLLYKVFRDKHFTSKNIQITFLRNDAGDEDTTPYRWLEESIICVTDPDKNEIVENSLNVVVDTGYDRFRTGGREVESTNIDTTVGNFMTPVLEKFDRVNYYKFRAQSKFPIRAVLYDSSSPVEEEEYEYLADLPESIKGTGYLDLRNANSSEWFQITSDLGDLKALEIRMRCHENNPEAQVGFGSVQETFLTFSQTNVDDEVYRFTWDQSEMYKIRLVNYGSSSTSQMFDSTLGTGLTPKTLSVKGTACEFWFSGQGFSRESLVTFSNTRKADRFDRFEDPSNIKLSLTNARYATASGGQENSGLGGYEANKAVDNNKGFSDDGHAAHPASGRQTDRFLIDLNQPTNVDFIKVWPRHHFRYSRYTSLLIFADTVLCQPMEYYTDDYVQNFLLPERKPLVFVCPTGTQASTIRVYNLRESYTELAEIEAFQFQSRKPVSINKYPLIEYQPLRWTQGKCLPDNMVLLEQGNFILTDNTRQYCFNLCNQHSADWVACQINPEGFDEGCYITHDGALASSQTVTTEVSADRLHVCYFREVPTSREEAVALKTRPSFEVWINEPDTTASCFVRIFACGREVAVWSGYNIFKVTESRSFYLSWFDDTLIFGQGHDIGERAIIALAQMSNFCQVNINELAFTGLAPPDSSMSTEMWMPPGYITVHNGPDDLNSMAYGGNFNNLNPRINTIDYGFFSQYPEETVNVNGYEIAVFDCDKSFNFFEAKARCQREGGSLIDVDSFNGRAISVNQLAEISEHFQQTCQLAVNNYWIDLLYSCTDSVWKRRNGQVFNEMFTDVESGKDIKYWANNQPVPVDANTCRPLSNCAVSAGWQGQLNDFGFQSSGCHYKIRGAVCVLPPKPSAREEVRGFMNTSPQKSIEEFAQLYKSAAFTMQGSDFSADLSDDQAFVIDSCRPTNDRTLCNSIYPREVLEAMQSQFGDLQALIDAKKREVCVYTDRATACIVDINKKDMKFSLDNFGDIGTPAYLDKTLRNTLALIKMMDEQNQHSGIMLSTFDVGFTQGQTPGKGYHANVDTRQLEKAYFGLKHATGLKRYSGWQEVCRNYHPEARVWEPRDHIEIIDVWQGVERARFNENPSIDWIEESFAAIELDYLNTLTSKWYGQQSLNYVYASDKKPFRQSLHADWGSSSSGRSVVQAEDDGDASVMIIRAVGDNDSLEYRFVDREFYRSGGVICEVDISSNPDSTGDLDHKAIEFSADDVDKWMDFTSSTDQDSHIGSRLRFVSTPMYAKDAEVHCRSLHENAQLYQPAIGRVKNGVDNSPQDANVERWLSVMASNIDDSHMWLGWRRNPYGVWDIRGRHGENVAGIGSVVNGGSYMDKGSNNWGTISDKSEFEQFQLNDDRADVVKTTILRSNRANTEGYEFVSANSERLPFVCEIPEYVREEKIYQIPTCNQVNFQEARAMCQDIGGDLMQASNVKNTNGHGRRDSYEKALLYYTDKCGRDTGFWTGAQITCGGDAPRPWNYVSDNTPLTTRNMFIGQPARDVNEILFHNSKCSTANSNCRDVLSDWDSCETFSMNIQISGTDLCFDGSITNINANGNYLGHKPCEVAEPLIAIKCGDEFKIMSSTGRFLYFDDSNLEGNFEIGAIKFTSGADCSASSFKSTVAINTSGNWVRETCLTDVSADHKLVPLSKHGLGRVMDLDCENNYKLNIKLTSKCGAPLEEDGDWIDLDRQNCENDAAAVMRYSSNDAGWVDSNVENHHGVVCVLSPERSRSTPKFNVDYTAAQGSVKKYVSKEYEYSVSSGDLLIKGPGWAMSEPYCNNAGGSLVGDKCLIHRTSNLYDRYTSRPAKPYLGQSFDCYQMTEKHIFQCSIAGMPKRNTPTINYLAFHEHVRAPAGTFQPEGSGEVGRKNMIQFYYENTAGVACSTGWKPCEPHQIRDRDNICQDRNECKPQSWGAGMLPNPMELAYPGTQDNVVDPELQPALQNFEYRSGELNQMCVAPISPIDETENPVFRIGSYRGAICTIAGDNNEVIVRSAMEGEPTSLEEAYAKDHYLVKNDVKRSYWTRLAVKPCLYEFFLTCRDSKAGTLTPLGRNNLRTLTVQECEDACFLMKKENINGNMNDGMCYDWNQTDGTCQCSIDNNVCEHVNDNWQTTASPALLSFRRGSFVQRGKRCCGESSAIDINDMRIAHDNVLGSTRDDERSACQKICNADLDCKFWSVNHDTKQCQLGSDLTAYETVYQSSTGSDTCGQIADADSGCVVNPGKGSNTDLMHHSEIQFVERYSHDDRIRHEDSTAFMAKNWKWSTLFTPAGVRTEGDHFATNEVYRFYIGRLNHARFNPNQAIQDFRNYNLNIFVRRASRPFRISVSGCVHVADSVWRSDGYALPNVEYSRLPWKFTCNREFNLKFDQDYQNSVGSEHKGTPNYLGIKIETSNGAEANVRISSIQVKRNRNVVNKECRNPGRMTITSVATGNSPAITWWYSGRGYQAPWKNRFYFEYIEGSDELYKIKLYNREICMRTDRTYRNQANLKLRELVWNRYSFSKVCSFRIKKMYMSEQKNWRYMILPERPTSFGQSQYINNDPLVDQYALVCGNRLNGRPITSFGRVYNRYTKCFFAAQKHSIGRVEYDSDWVFAQSLFEIKAHDMWRASTNWNCLNNQYLYNFQDQDVPLYTRGSTQITVNNVQTEYPLSSKEVTNPMYAGIAWRHGKQWGGYVDTESGEVGYAHNHPGNTETVVSMTATYWWRTYYIFEDCCEGGECVNMGANANGLFDGETVGVDAYYRCVCPPNTVKKLVRYGVYKCSQSGGSATYCNAGRANPQYYSNNPDDEPLAADCDSCADPNQRVDPRDSTRCTTMRSYCKFGRGYDLTNTADLEVVHEHLWRYNLINGRNYEQCKTCNPGYFEEWYTVDAGTAEWDDLNPNKLTVSAMRCVLKVCTCYERGSNNKVVGYGTTGVQCPNNGDNFCRSCYRGYGLDQGRYCEDNTWHLASPGGNIGFVRTGWGRTFTRTSPGQSIPSYFSYWYSYRVRHRRWSYYRPWWWIYFRWWWHWIFRWFGRWTYWYETKRVYRYSWSVKGYPVVRLMRKCSTSSGCEYAWGSVCDDGFGRNEATSWCTNLGYDSRCTGIPGWYSRRISRFSARGGRGLPSYSYRIAMDDLRCPRIRSNVGSQCSKRPYGTHNCGHWEDVILECAHP